MTCWLLALGFLAVFAIIAWYITQFGGAALVKRDRQQHLAILNAARKRSGKPPLTEADLPPEPEEELPIKLPKGFLITSPPPPPPPLPTPPPLPPQETVREAARVPPPIPAGVGAAELAAAGAMAQSVVLIEQGFHAFSQAGLQAQVERAWGVVFPKGEDVVEWVKYPGPPAPAVISCAGYIFTVENSPRRYEGFAAGEELGNGYRSIAIGPNDLEPENAYALLGKLAVELSSGSTLAVYLPQFGERYAYTPATRDALLSDDPVAALRAAAGVTARPSPTGRSAAARQRLQEVSPSKPAPKPVIPVDESFESPEAILTPDVPTAAPVPANAGGGANVGGGANEGPTGLAAAMREARRRLPEFEAAFRESGLRSDPFLVKSAFSDASHTEYMWSEVVEITPTHIVGILRSAPMRVTGYREGQNVMVPVEDVADWIGYRETPGGFEPIGNFTGPLLNG